MVTRFSWDIMHAFGRKWRAFVYFDNRQVATGKFDSYDEAYSWVCNEIAMRSSAVEER